MSSSGILSVNSGPLIIRTYLDGSNNNSYVLGQYDVPVASGSIITTSTNGLLVPSNNINISTLSSNTINTSSLIVSTINGVVPISSGTNYSDYLFWNNTTTAWEVGNSTIHIGSFAGSTSQDIYSIAIGYEAGMSSQSSLSIAIGYNAGTTGQQEKSIAIGNNAGINNQNGSAIAIGNFTAGQNQGSSGIAIGTSAAIYNQGGGAIAIGAHAGYFNQSSLSIAIGYYTASTSQDMYSIAIGSYAGQINQSSNTIILNASGSVLNSYVSSSLYINPVRNDNSAAYSTLQYNMNTSEITYANKTFVIQHPLKQDNYLVHACLEGPESGVYYRGTAKVHSKFVEIQLPEYAAAIADTFTVNVTHILDEDTETHCKHYSATRVKDGRFRIYGPSGSVDWVVFGKRADIDVEPLKTAVDVKGGGPYKWIKNKE